MADEIQLKSAYDIYKHRHKTLIHNWEEERRIIDLKRSQILPDDPSELQHGHPGILTISEKAPFLNITDSQYSYQYPKRCYVRELGLRRECRERELSEKIQADVMAHLSKLPERPDYKTTTGESFNIEGFESIPPKPKEFHDYRTEQPLSYWADNFRKIYGVSNVKTRDTVFRKNDAFTKPMGLYWGQARPYDLERYPLM